MQTGANQLKKPLLLLFACIMICWTETGLAFEPLRGKATANLNLRTSPGPGGKIITGLKKGENVIITDQHENWYQILIERGTYGYKGWAYGKYIKKIHTEKEGAALPLEEKKQKTPIKESLTEDSSGGKDEKAESLAISQENAFPQESLPGFKNEVKRQTTMLNDRVDFNKGQVIGAFIRLLLKLTSLVLSCLALLFSYKALQIAKVSRDVAKQLESNFEI